MKKLTVKQHLAEMRKMLPPSEPPDVVIILEQVKRRDGPTHWVWKWIPKTEPGLWNITASGGAPTEDEAFNLGCAHVKCCYSIGTEMSFTRSIYKEVEQ